MQTPGAPGTVVEKPGKKRESIDRRIDGAAPQRFMQAQAPAAAGNVVQKLHKKQIVNVRRIDRTAPQPRNRQFQRPWTISSPSGRGLGFFVVW